MDLVYSNGEANEKVGNMLRLISNCRAEPTDEQYYFVVVYEVLL